MNNKFQKYIDGYISREELINEPTNWNICKDVKEESKFGHLMTIMAEQEYNNLIVSRKSILNYLDLFKTSQISKENLMTWAWDTIDLNAAGTEDEQILISRVLHVIDNIEINDNYKEDLLRIHDILKNIIDSKQALDKIHI